MSTTDEARQRAYYQATAAHYHDRRTDEEGEHELASELLVMLARHHGVAFSFLDVGAGRGSAMKALVSAFPQARLQGIEPVAELRQQAKIINGSSGAALREGDALQLPFADDSIDCVVETGMLDHIRHWPPAVEEMAWVALYGVLNFDNNNIGHGSIKARMLKKLMKILGLWTAFVLLHTKGKMSKGSEGDRVYFSFCAFDTLPLLRSKFAQVLVMNTKGPAPANLLSPSTHVAMVARQQLA